MSVALNRPCRHSRTPLGVASLIDLPPSASQVESNPAAIPSTPPAPAATDPDPAAVVGEIERYLAGRSYESNRSLVTLLFTDIVGSTRHAAQLGDRRWRNLLEEHHIAVRRELAYFGGCEVDSAGDGFLATFDLPSRAVRCAGAIVDAVRLLGLEIRAGLHAGECERLDDKVVGIAVHVGGRIAASAAPGEVLVSNTVKDLVGGSDLRFEDRGVHTLKGIPDPWHLFLATR